MKSGSDKMPRRTHLLALEPRMMFDAAAGAVVQNAVLSNGDAAHGASTDHAAAFAHGADAGFHDTHMIVPDGIGAAARSATPSAATTAPHDVIFIDTAVADYQQLVSEWAGKGEIVLIDSTKDGIDQMRAALAGDSNVAAIHIVSHGEEGVLFLGTTRIDEATIEGDLSGSLAAIGRSLAPGGDILLYGCDFAEGADGARALAAFAQATHADVAASTDLTGYAGKGGDWVLEAHDGAIQAHTLSSDDWAHTLDPNVFVPIAVTPDSLTVTDASGKVITTGTTGYVTNSKADTTQRSANVGAGAVARWNDAATLADGTKVDLLATVVSISNGDFVQFNRPTSAANGDDPTFLLRDASNGNATNGDGANVQILWQLVVSGTTTPIAANVEFGILDIDGVGGKPNSREAVSVATDNLAYYTAESATDIAIAPSLSQIQASGTQNENTDSTKPLDTKSEVTFDWTKVSAFTINYSLAKNNGFTTQAQFYQDGNADFKYSNPVYVSVPRLDLDANDSTAPGNDAHFVATAGQGDSAIVDSDVVVSNPMDVNSVQGATVTLTNAVAGDALHVGTLPSNITATVTNGNGTISVALSGTGSQTDYDTALRAVTFANTLASPDTTQRVIDVAFTNGTLTSATAVSRIDINHAPVANPDSASIPEEATRTIAVLANDTDADGDPLTVTSASAQNGTVTINTDGTLSYTSNALYRGTDTITYTIADGRGGTATSTVAVTVTPVNHAPQDVGTLPSQASQDAATVSYQTANAFHDPDGDTLSYSATGLPTGLSIDPSSGIISGTIDHSASQVNGGSYAIAVTATDPSNASATQNFTLSVTNPPPVAHNDTAAVHVNTAKTIAVLTNDVDPDGDALTVTSASAQHGSVVINSDGTITYTPNTGYAGTDTIPYTISDGQGGTSNAVVNVTVGNAAPTNTAFASQSANDGQSVSLPTASHFSDADGDTLTYSATGLPTGLSIDPSTGVISGTIDRSASQLNGGAYDSTVTANDGHGGTDAATLHWQIANPPPVARDDTATTPEEVATTIAVLSNDSDPDGDPLSVTSASAQHGSVAINPDNTITYTPNALYRGSDSIAYTISDGQGGTSSAHVAVTVTPVNHAPQDVGTLPAQTSQDAASVSYATAGAFSDPDGDSLTYTATGLPKGLSIDPSSGIISGTIDHSASQVNSGSYAIAVAATDPSNASATQTFTLSITNPPPVAHDDTATTPEEAAATIAVLANDVDPDGDALTVTSATAQHGSVVINGDNTITYTPNALYRGSDSIAYAISDGQGGTSSAHVAVTVTPVNHPPQDVAIPANYGSADGTAVNVSITGAFTDPDGDTLTYGATGLPAGLSIDPVSGVISGTIDRSASQVNGGVYAVTLTATDPSNTSAAQHVTLSVTNPPPVAVDDSASTHVDTPRTIAVLANDHDPDGDPLTVTGATPQSGTAVVNPDGTITYTPAHGFAGTDTIAYTISDGQGGTANAVVTVTIGNAAPTNTPLGVQSANDGQTVSLPVASFFSDADGDTMTYSATDLPAGLSIDPATGIISGTIDRSASQVNGGAYKTVITADDGHGGTDAARLRWQIANPPPVAHDDSATTPEEVATTIAVLANDVDPDGDPLTVTSATAQHGSVAINPDGTITYTPDALYRGTDSIAYSITDGQGGTSSAQVAVTVTPVNHAPQDVGTLPSQASQDAATVSYQTASAFNDPDGDTLTYAATGLPAGLSIDPASGIISGTIDHSASQSNGGSYAIVVEATDPSNASTTQSFALSVTNPPPVAYDDRATVHVDTPASIAVLANDVDPDGDALTVTGASAQHGAVVVNADGTITYTPATGFSGSDVIAYSISDGQGGISNAVVDVTVGNTPPIDTPFAAQSASDGQTVSLPLASHFSDADGDPLTYTATGLPAGLSIDPATGIVGGTIDRSASQVNGGAYDSVVTANDGHGGTDAATLHWQVANPAPTAQDDSATTPEETPVVIAVLANDHDPDGDPLTVTSASAQHGSVAINPDGTVTYTPDALYRGADSIAYTIGDGQGGTSAAHVAVTVTPVDHAPVAQTIATQSAADAQSVTLDVGGFFADPDGDRLTYSATGLPPGVTIDPATGRIAGTLDHSASRGSVYHVVVTATDPSNAKASSSFDWTIVNPAPVAADDTATVAEDGQTIVAVLANDHDPDGDPLTVTTATAQHGSVTINPDNTLTYTPGPYYRGNDVIVYTIADGDGGTASASVMVTVTPVNHAPTATNPLTGQSAVEGSNVAIPAAPLFHDVDGDALTYAATGLPKGLSIDPTSGTITGIVDREAASQAPGGIYTVSVTATDPSGLGAMSTFALAVTNPPPVVADSSAHTPEDTGIVLPALANARDPDGDPMTVTAASADHGSVTINPDGTIAYQPGASFSGADIVRYTVTDADGASATATVSVTVDHVNHPPVVPTQGDPIAAVGGRPVQIDALAGVTDPDGDGATIVQASSANGRVAVNPDGTLVFTPDLGFAGTTTIRYMVADGNGGFTEGVYVVRVADGRGADINELLEIGRVKFVDPSPGFVNIVVPDGVVRTPLTILDTVEAVRSLNTTVIGRQLVGDAVEAIRTLDGTYVDPAHPVLGEVARLDSLRDQRDAGDRLFDHRWGDFLVKGITGFSVANDRTACITVESVVRGGAIYVEVRDTAGEGTSPIRSVDIRPASGGVPDWIKVDHRGLAIVERAADMDELHLIVRVIRANGHTSTTPIVIQGATGEIELDRQHNAPAGHHRAAPLDATLHTHHAATRAHAAHIDRIFK